MTADYPSPTVRALLKQAKRLDSTPALLLAAIVLLAVASWKVSTRHDDAGNARPGKSSAGRVGCIYDIHDVIDRSVEWHVSYHGSDLWMPTGGWDITNRMILYIEFAVDPGEWDYSGGHSSIQRAGQCLYVTAPPIVQQHIRKFLAQFRQVDAMAPSGGGK